MASDPLTIFNEHELNKFLKNHYTDLKDPSLTGTTGSLVKGKWNIDNDYTKYYDLLNDYLFVKFKNGEKTYLYKYGRVKQ